jgi:hypothetical protein
MQWTDLAPAFDTTDNPMVPWRGAAPLNRTAASRAALLQPARHFGTVAKRCKTAAYTRCQVAIAVDKPSRVE